MAFNRKMRKFEGTCYIPGEQLAMMAKYYRGANLNLNLTLFEDDFATMQETLDQACWCSKLDELDRMKMAHMQGNEWRIQHEHCLQEAQQGRNPKVYPALPQSSRSAVGKVERGTSAVSLYDRERGVVRGGRYRKDDYSEPHNRRDDYDRHDSKEEYPRNRMGYYSDKRSAREGYDMYYRRDDYLGPSTHREVLRSENRTGRNMGGPPDKRYDMESEAALSSMPEAAGDIRCAVCNVETCLVCKNHLYSSICRCKCAVANAGLCNKCTQEPCEEEEQVAQETGGNKMDMSSMMLTMMMSSMLRPQAQESVCCCKPSRDRSESSSSNSTDGKVHKVYLYDCEDHQKGKKSKKNSKKAGSDSSSACDCCKCSRKPKKNPGKKGGCRKTSGEETSDSDSYQKHPSRKGKGSEDSRKKLKGGDGDSDTDLKPKGSKESTRKSTSEKRQSNKSSKEDDRKSVKSENMQSMKMMNENRTVSEINKGKLRVPKAQGSIDSRNVQFLDSEKMSPIKSQELNSSESDLQKRSTSAQKPPPTLGPGMSELLDIQQNVPDLDSSNHTKKDGDTDGMGEESSTTFSLRELVVCLPKIQSNLQSLMYKLNQMDLVNNKLQYPQTDPSMANAQLRISEMHMRRDVPLLSSPPTPSHYTPGSWNNEHPLQYNQYQKQDSEISIGYSPGKPPVQNFPPTISPGSSKDESKLPKRLNPPTRYQSIANFSNPGQIPESTRMTAGDRKHFPQVSKIAESTKQSAPFKFSPFIQEVNTRNNGTKSGQQWPYSKRNPIAASPPLTSTNIEQNSPQSYLEIEPISSQMYYKKQPGKILNYQKVNEGNVSNVRPPSIVFSQGGSHNVEIIELPETKPNPCNQIHSLSRIPNQMAHRAGAVLTLSQYDGETIFQSYNKETSADTSDITDYASFTDEKQFQLSPATSAEQATHETTIKIKDATKNVNRRSEDTNHHYSNFSKFTENNCEERALSKTRSVLKAPKGVAFKAKQRNPLEKLVHGRTLRNGRSQVAGLKNDVIKVEKADPGGMAKMKLLDQGVGPGKFRRSKSDSSLESPNPSNKNFIASSIRPKTPKARIEMRTVTPTSAGKDHTGIPFKRKRSASPVKEKARHTIATKKNSLQPKRKGSLVLGKFGLKNITSNQTKESDSMFKMSDAYVRQELGSQSYIVSSVEVKTINDHRSSTDILKMVQGMASSSLINVTNVSSVSHQTAPLSSDGFDIIPMLPLSATTPTDGHESKSEMQSGPIAMKQVSFENDVSPNTPAFLRKSRVQVEQLKRAHATIRSMIKNVNDVIAHIDSDSKIGIKSKTQDRERQSYFVQLDEDDGKRQSHGKPQDRRNEPHHFGRQVLGGSTKPVCSNDVQSREVREMFLSVNRVINSVMTPSEQSDVTEDAQCSSENTTPSRARRDFFILNSESSSTAFTESLRRSLENDSRSVPLAAQQVPVPPRATSQRDPRTTRKLRRRSWFPPPKK